MRSVKAWVRLSFYAELPDDDVDADTAFDAMLDGVKDALADAAIPGVAAESFMVDDADTKPDE